MAIALNDYLFTPVAGVMTPWVNVWVRLVSNNTSTAYISDAATDSKGRFTFATKPPGDTYTVYTGPTNVGAWTSTGDVAYAVPVVQGENPSFQSETTQSIGPYAPSAIAGQILSQNIEGLLYADQVTGAKVYDRMLAAATSVGTQLEGLVVIPANIAGMANAVPTVANIGTPGATPYTYLVIAQSTNGQDVAVSPSSYVATTTGNAVLDGTNYNRISWPSVPGAGAYLVFRSLGGATQGLIATVSAPTLLYNDQGAVGAGFNYAGVDLNPTTTLPANVTLLDFRYLPTDQQIGLNRVASTNAFQTSAFRLSRRFDVGNDSGFLLSAESYATGGTSVPGISGEGGAIYAGAIRTAGARGVWGMNINMGTSVNPTAAMSTYGLEIDVNNNSGINATATTIMDGIFVVAAGTKNSRFGAFIGNSGSAKFLDGILVGAVYTDAGIVVNNVGGTAVAARLQGVVQIEATGVGISSVINSALQVDGGPLGAVAANEVHVASFGTSGPTNSTALTIHAYRQSGGSDWTTQQYILGYDVDSSEQLGAYMMFTHDGGIGIGTKTPTGGSGFLTVAGALLSLKDRRISKQSPAFNAAPAPDPTAGEIYAMAALTGAVNVANPVNAAQGQRLFFIWTQDGTGGRAVAYTGTNWRSVGIAAQTTTLSTVTIDEAVCVDGTVWRVNRLVTGQTV